jgi:hypothetical protein
MLIVLSVFLKAAGAIAELLKNEAHEMRLMNEQKLETS